MLKHNFSSCTLFKNYITDVFNIWTIEDKRFAVSKEIFVNEIK